MTFDAYDELLTAVRSLISPEAAPPMHSLVVDSNPGPDQMASSEFAMAVGKRLSQIVVEQVPELPHAEDGSPREKFVKVCTEAMNFALSAASVREGSIGAAMSRLVDLSVPEPVGSAQELVSLIDVIMRQPFEIYQQLESNKGAWPEQAGETSVRMVTLNAIDGFPLYSLLDTYDGDINLFANGGDELAIPILPSDCAKAVDRSGYPSDWVFGGFVHADVQQKYRRLHPNDLVVWERLYWEGGAPKKLLEAPEGSAPYLLNYAVTWAYSPAKKENAPFRIVYKRPDLANLTSGDFYEIKSNREAVEGYRQLRAYYLDPYETVRKLWQSPTAPKGILGRTDQAPSGFTIGLDSSLDNIVFGTYYPACPGLILYNTRFKSSDWLTKQIIRTLRKFRGEKKKGDGNDEGGTGGGLAPPIGLVPGGLAGNDNSEDEGERRVARVIVRVIIAITQAAVAIVIGVLVTTLLLAATALVFLVMEVVVIPLVTLLGVELVALLAGGGAERLFGGPLSALPE